MFMARLSIMLWWISLHLLSKRKAKPRTKKTKILCYEPNERSQFSFASRKEKKPYGTRLLTHITNLIPHRRNVWQTKHSLLTPYPEISIKGRKFIGCHVKQLQILMTTTASCAQSAKSLRIKNRFFILNDSIWKESFHFFSRYCLRLFSWARF